MRNAAINMHLNFEEYNNSKKFTSTRNFLRWVKNHVVKQHPVAIGVYENASIFKGAADKEYDHIVPVFGISSSHDLTDSNPYKDDILLLRDNGLYTGANRSPVYCYSYPLDSFQTDRMGANKFGGNLYSLSNNKNKLGNFGIAITGVRSTGVALAPVRVMTNPSYETPAIREGSSDRPKPQSMTLTIRVSNLTPSTTYILYKYTEFDNLPVNDDFSKSVGAPDLASTCSFHIFLGDHFTTHQSIQSNQKAIYRAIIAKPTSKLPAPCMNH